VPWEPCLVAVMCAELEPMGLSFYDQVLLAGTVSPTFQHSFYGSQIKSGPLLKMMKGTQANSRRTIGYSRMALTRFWRYALRTAA